MKARRAILLAAGLLLLCLPSLVWAAQTSPISAGNLKGVTVAAPQAKSAGALQHLTVQGEELSYTAPADEPEIVYTLTDKMQGGENIATAYVIPGMPFVDTGTTVGYADDYSEACDGINTAARPDVVFAYTPTVNELVDITLCKSSFATRLWVYQTDASNRIACNRFDASACAQPRSTLKDVPMDAGITYYIVIDGDYQLTPNQGQYIIECSATQPQDSVSRWPALADNGKDLLLLGYSFNNALDSQMYWQSSVDDGTSFGPAGWWTQGGWSRYASADYWGKDSTFYGTFVPGPKTSSGGPTYLHRFWDASDPSTWVLSYWNWTSYGWHDMKMADIACADGVVFPLKPSEQRFGVISMVHSSTYGTPDLGVDAPHLFYEVDSSSSATISWYNDLNGCRSTTCDIDKVTKYSYAAYDRYNTTATQWQLFVRGDVFGNPDDTLFSGGFTYALDPGQQIGYPAVAANAGNVLIASEYSEDATPNDHDILLWFDPTTTGRYDTLQTSVVIATTDDERFPRLQVISGTSFLLTYIANNQLYMTVTEDGGATWTTPSVVSNTDHVVSEYRGSDISEGGGKVIWEYQPGLPDDTTIFLHFALTGVVVDSDSDGFDDDLDNCPTIANPGQEDADGDGIGDVCDACTDTDGDGFGNPGYPANTCAVDNCPTVANADQADADGDGQGNVCDNCTDTDNDGFGNPGYPANTCTVDNCPNRSNPGQEDSNSDGIGDACCCVVRGDYTHDGSVKVSDLTAMVNFLFKAGPAAGCPSEADVTADGSVKVSDLTFLVNFLFKGGPAPSACS